MKTSRLCAFACVAALALSNSATTAPVPPAAKETPENQQARLVGRWQVTSYMQSGVEQIADKKNPRVMIAAFKADGTFRWEHGAEELGKIARIDPTKNPKEIDYLFTAGGFKDKTQKAIYKFDGDTYTDCCGEPGTDRPTEFKSTAENKCDVMVFKRLKEEKKID